MPYPNAALILTLALTITITLTNPNPNPTLTLTKAAAATARAAEAELRVAQLTMRCMDLAGSPCASSSPHVQRCTDLDDSPH